jgi:alkanesulfonate monooxygenase SsuD/methylene tetrahydromethanopterin reductase-like flavin-dependent oxidoreductase (luciferase family)
VNDPVLLIPALAHATEHLSFACTSSVLQTPPCTFARQVSTLDPLSRGGVAWNLVTSSLPHAGASLGYGGLPAHAERYERAETEDDTVLRDPRRGLSAEPAQIHPIHHVGKYYDVAGPHLADLSP